MTKNQLARIGKDLAGIAGEPVEVEDIKGVVYVFGSELATLRLLLQYRNNTQARVGYSQNYHSHFFSLELNFEGQNGSCRTKKSVGQESKIQSEKYNKDLHAVDAKLEQESKVRDNKYLVTWEIDSEERSPVAAAKDAFEVMKHPESLGGCFEVWDKDTNRGWYIDLSNPKENHLIG